MQIILFLYYCIILNEIRSYSPLLYYDYWPVSEGAIKKEYDYRF